MNSLPTIDVILTVHRFRDAINGALRGGSLTDHDIDITNPNKKCHLKDGDYQRRSGVIGERTIRVESPGAILRFIVAGAGADTEIYHPIGIAFARADGTEPAAVFLKFAQPNSPFNVVEAQLGILVIEDAIAPGLEGRNPTGRTEIPPYITYKFSVIIQRKSDGAIGIIDPYIENQN